MGFSAFLPRRRLTPALGAGEADASRRRLGWLLPLPWRLRRLVRPGGARERPRPVDRFHDGVGAAGDGPYNRERQPAKQGAQGTSDRLPLERPARQGRAEQSPQDAEADGEQENAKHG
jgi:hypothetical protein